MKKFFVCAIVILLMPFFAACEVSNTELANSLEGNLTRLVYSVGYLDSVSTEDLTGLVNNSSYFTHSSLFTGGATTANNESTETNNADPLASDTNAALTGGLDASKNAENSNLTNTTTINKTTAPNSGLATTTTTDQLSGGLVTDLLPSGRTAFQDASYRSNLYNTSIGTTPLTAGGYASGTVDMSLLESNAQDLNEILLSISAKRGIIMLYCTDLRSGRATLSAENKAAISEYNNIIKETTNYLNSNTGVLTNHFNGITSISTAENSAELINAKLIRANEVLKTRYAKLDTCLDSMNAIINILVSSIGYDYATLYNASIAQNQIENITPDSSSNITTNSALESTEITETPNTVVQDGTAADQMEVDPIVDNSTTYPAIKNDCPCENLTPNGDTIINVNYDNNEENRNSSNTTLTKNTTEPNGINNNTAGSTYSIRYCENCGSPIFSSTCNNCSNKLNNIDTTTEVTEKNTSLTQENAENLVLNIAKLKPKKGPLQNKESATEIGLGDAVEKRKPLAQETFPPVTLDEPEITESERELTPDLLPFAGEQNAPKTLELKPFPAETELGVATFLPFVYEESDVTQKIPRK